MGQIFSRVLVILLIGGSTCPAHADNIITEDDIVVIKSPQGFTSRQRLPNFLGISATSAGSKVLSMNLVIIPPAAEAEAHYHDGYESAIYVIEGTVETRYGPNLSKSVINEAGDFIFIPPNVPHQPRNLSSSQRAMAIVARNDPNEQESVVPYVNETD